MTITSKFYTGAVNNIDWALGMRGTAHRYAVQDHDGTGTSFKVAINGSITRGYTVAAGVASGGGITDINDATLTGASFALPFNATDRWWLIGLKRTWGGTLATVVDYIAGTSTKAIPSRPSTPGTQDFQPLALAFVPAGGGAITQMVDLRAISNGAGPLVAVDDMVKDYLNAVGTQLLINGTRWTRDLKADKVTPRWSSSKAACRVTRTTNLSIPFNTTTTVGFTDEVYDYDGMHDNVTNNSRVTIQTAGIYHLVFTGELGGATPTDYGQIRVSIMRNGGNDIILDQVNPIDAASSLPQRLNISTAFELSEGDYVEVRIFQTNDSSANRFLVPTADYSPMFTVTRIG